MGFEELWDGFDKITEKTAAGEEFTRTIIKYLEKRHEVETKYAKGLAHLVPIFATDKEDGTTQAAWHGLRDEMDTQSKDRVAFCAEVQKLIDDLKGQLLNDKKNRAELLAKGRKLVKDLAATEEIHKQSRLKYVEARKKQQKSDELFKKIKAQGGNTTKPEKTLKKDKDKANTADHEYRKKVIQLANAQDKFHLDDMPSLLKEFEAFERARLTATKKHFIHFTSLQASLGPATTQSTDRFKKKAEAVDTKADLDLYVSKNRPATDQPPARAQYMSWDGTVVEDVGPPRAKPSGGKMGSSAGTNVTKIEEKPKAYNPPEEKITVSQPVVVQQPSMAVTPTESKQRKLVSLYAYDATEDGELTFDEGAVILVIGENESGWWRGRLDSGAEGLFPSNFMMSEQESNEKMAEMANAGTAHHSAPAVSVPVVAEVPKAEVVIEPEPVSEPIIVSTGGVAVPINANYVAMFDYDAEDDTELTIHEGEILFVVSETDGWYLGNNESGQKGNFPSNFVERKDA